MRCLLSAICLSSAMLVPLAAHADTYTVTSLNATFSAAEGPHLQSYAIDQPVSSNSAAIVWQFTPTGSGTAVTDSLTIHISVDTAYGTETITQFGTTTASFSPGFDSWLFTPGKLTYGGVEEYNVAFSSANSIPNGSTATVYAEFYANPSFMAATPEPGSLALLGTGMVGAFGMVRRRLCV